jgi:hypothetical protein
MSRRREELRRSLLIAAGSFVAYGSWAAFANWAHGPRVYVVSGLTQASISFVVTATLALGMEAVFRRLRSGLLRFVVTALGPQSAVAALTAAAHWAVGTPEILMTMAPSLIVGAVFCLLYTAGLEARARTPRN